MFDHETSTGPGPESGSNQGSQLAAELATIALSHEALRRGERQLPDEPNRGFRIERLEQEHPPEPVPVEQVFPSSEDFKAREFARQYLDGTTPTQIVADAWTGTNQGEPGFVVFLPVEASKYSEAVAAGQLPADLFGDKGTVAHIQPGAAGLDGLVGSDQKRAAIEDYYRKEINPTNHRKQGEIVDRYYIDDLEGVTDSDQKSARHELQEVSEAYELSDSGRSIRLVNFSRTRMSEEQLRQAVNTVRAMSDKSGGALFDQLHTIAVIPEEYPSMQNEKPMPDGTTEMLPTNGYKSEHMLVLSDRLLKPPELRKPLPPSVKEFFEQYRLPHEPKEGPDAPRKKVSDEDWELTLAHELSHIALPADIQDQATLPGPAATLFGRSNKVEHIAELGAAEYAGGDEQALAVPEDQREAYGQLWRQQRGGEDDNTMLNHPEGPRFVVCRELDLTQGPLPLRPKQPGRPLPVEVEYRLKTG